MCIGRQKMARTEMLLLSEILLLLCFYTTTHSYNIEEGLPLFKDYPSSYDYPDNESYFGFSIAQHQYTRSDGEVENLLLVGAPKLQTNQVDVKQGGGVFRCPISTYTDDCTLIDIDPEGNLEGENKTDQWFGVTVRSQGKDGKILACAHRYKQVSDTYRYGYGRCFQMVMDETSNTFKLDDSLTNGGIWTLCEGRTGGNEGYGYCQSGTDSDFSRDGKDIIVGTPGSMDWRGVAFVTDITGDLQADPTIFKSPETADDSTVLKFSYLGIAVSSGNFNGSDTWYVAGAPGHNASGAVVLFAKGQGNLVPQQTIYSEQLASSFGYDVEVVDLNDDGYDDLVVGAPLYYERQAGIGGRVYVYMNDGMGTLIEKDRRVISGMTDSMFGMTVRSVGDLDIDGYNDIAIGAPYENDGQGAIYIFQGGPNGLRDTYSQKITPEKFPNGDMMKTFGYSIDGGMDLDNNGYPDIAVGLYQSSKVVLFRTRPVLTIGYKLSAVPMRLDNENKNCTHKGKDYVCFKVHVCLHYTTTSTSFRDKITADYTLTLEKPRTSLGLKSRVFFGHGGTDVFTNDKKLNRPDSEKCDVVEVFVNDGVEDFLNPIEVALSYSIPEEERIPASPGEGIPSMSNFPILNMTTMPSPILVDFVKDCGPDNKCLSDLSVKAEYDLPGDPPTLSVGSPGELVVTVTVRNDGESAYMSKYTMFKPESLEYINYDDIALPDGVVFSCDDDKDNKTVITCEIGNPLPANAEIQFILRFDPSAVKGAELGLTMDMFVETSSTETNPENDRISIYAKVEVVTDLNLFGQSDPSSVPYSGVVRGESAMEYEDQIGNEVVHTYYVQNKGPGDVEMAFVTFHWPYEVANGKWLLYMTDYPRVIGEGSCSIDAYRVNFLQVKKRGQVGTFTYEAGGESEERVRRRRNVAPSHDLIGPAGEKKGRIETLSCDHGTARCFTFNCTIGPLEGGKTSSIMITSRLWNSTFLEDYRTVTRVNIVSRAEMKILNAPYIRQTDVTNDKVEVTTEASPDIGIIIAKKGIPMWIYIVAALAGLFLLIIVVLILWRCGFFKRKRVGHNSTSFRGASRNSRNGSMERKPSYKYEQAYQDERYN
ncbi:integrin alpha-6-like [Ptychodera flava]|uniref:integrin alpha-6-like n=1 Tax=Ptychodera flava TaxID=63121 RepID=UPI003969F5CC